MKLNIDTLTQEQRKQLDLGYNIFINDDGKLVTEDPTVITPAYTEYKSALIIVEFERKLKPITDKYSQSMRDSFEKKEREANKVIAGGNSNFITKLCLDDETPLELAQKIIANAEAFDTIFAEAEKKMREDLKIIS